MFEILRQEVREGRLRVIRKEGRVERLLRNERREHREQGLTVLKDLFYIEPCI